MRRRHALQRLQVVHKYGVWNFRLESLKNFYKSQPKEHMFSVKVSVGLLGNGGDGRGTAAGKLRPLCLVLEDEVRQYLVPGRRAFESDLAIAKMDQLCGDAGPTLTAETHGGGG
jgi:hypothetical protein